MPGFAVDAHPEKAKIIEGILAGRPVREIASMVFPPIAFCAVQRYKANVVKPVLARASTTDHLLKAKTSSEKPRVALSADAEVIHVTQQALADAPQLSVFRQRLEKLHGRIDRTLDKAETAQRVVDVDGQLVAVGADLSPLAPLMNQAHKNLEMLGRATGELEPQGGSGVSIQIVCPAAGEGGLPRVSFASREQLELEAPAGAMAEIGVLQKTNE